MVQDNAFMQQQFGNEPNASRMALDLRRGVKGFMRGLYTSEPALVVNYDIKRQTVDLVQMNSPKGLGAFYKDVPILGDVDADYTVIRPIRTVESGRPTTGMLLFPRTDSRKVYGKREQRQPYTTTMHTGEAPVFIPGFRTLSDTPASIVKDVLDENNVSPGDYAIIHKKSGSHFVMKDNGDIIIRATGNIYMGSTDSDINDMTKVELKGIGIESNNVYMEES